MDFSLSSLFPLSMYRLGPRLLPESPPITGSHLLSTIFAFPPPHRHIPDSAPPRPNNSERVSQRRVFGDSEPQMQALICSLDEKSCLALHAAAEMVQVQVQVVGTKDQID